MLREKVMLKSQTQLSVIGEVVVQMSEWLVAEEGKSEETGSKGRIKVVPRYRNRKEMRRRTKVARIWRR